MNNPSNGLERLFTERLTKSKLGHLGMQLLGDPCNQDPAQLPCRPHQLDCRRIYVRHLSEIHAHEPIVRNQLDQRLFERCGFEDRQFADGRILSGSCIHFDFTFLRLLPFSGSIIPCRIRMIHETSTTSADTQLRLAFSRSTLRHAARVCQDFTPPSCPSRVAIACFRNEFS